MLRLELHLCIGKVDGEELICPRGDRVVVLLAGDGEKLSNFIAVVAVGQFVVGQFVGGHTLAPNDENPPKTGEVNKWWQRKRRKKRSETIDR